MSASEFVLPGQKGFAVFDEKGKISGSEFLKVGADGNILIDSLFTHVNAQGYSIRNVTIKDAQLDGVRSAVMGELFIYSVNPQHQQYEEMI